MKNNKFTTYTIYGNNIIIICFVIEDTKIAPNFQFNCSNQSIHNSMLLGVSKSCLYKFVVTFKPVVICSYYFAIHKICTLGFVCEVLYYWEVDVIITQ